MVMTIFNGPSSVLHTHTRTPMPYGTFFFFEMELNDLCDGFPPSMSTLNGVILSHAFVFYQCKVIIWHMVSNVCVYT